MRAGWTLTGSERWVGIKANAHAFSLFLSRVVTKNGGKRGGGRIVGTVCRHLLSCIFMGRDTIFMIGVTFYIFSLEHFEHAKFKLYNTLHYQEL